MQPSLQTLGKLLIGNRSNIWTGYYKHDTAETDMGNQQQNCHSNYDQAIQGHCIGYIDVYSCESWILNVDTERRHFKLNVFDES